MTASKPHKPAPAERATWEELYLQIAALNANDGLTEILQQVSDQIVLLNSQRQVVFINAAALKGLALEDPAEVYGCRPGEVFGCVNVALGDGGCGTSDRCQLCGGLNVIMRCLDGYADVQRCTVVRQGAAQPLELIIHSIPVRCSEISLCLLNISSAKSENPKQAAEVTFRMLRYAARIEQL
jgi:PAS domain-containing protein